MPGNESDTKFLSHYPVKRLPAEVLLDAISQVTEVPTPFAGYPAGWRSLQLPDNKVESTFLDVVRPAGAGQHLLVRALVRAVDDPGAPPGQRDDDQREAPLRLQRRGREAHRPERRRCAIVDRLFLSALSRRPDARPNASAWIKVLKDAGGTGADPKARTAARRQAIEDLYWAVLTSKEFLFNH